MFTVTASTAVAAPSIGDDVLNPDSGVPAASFRVWVDEIATRQSGYADLIVSSGSHGFAVCLIFDAVGDVVGMGTGHIRNGSGRAVTFSYLDDIVHTHCFGVLLP